MKLFVCWNYKKDFSNTWFFFYANWKKMGETPKSGRYSNGAEFLQLENGYTEFGDIFCRYCCYLAPEEF